MRQLLAPAAVALAVVVAGCAGGGGSGGKPVVVATTTQAAEFARHVAGDRAEVKQILTPNTDPHEYEPRPSDAEAVANAKVVIRSGGDVDDWLGDLIDQAGGGAEVVSLIDHVHKEGDDPHWWQDPRRAERAVAAIGTALAKADQAGAAGYRARADAYEKDLRTLDAAVAHCIDELPLPQRKLVTTHDALGYYAHRYGLQVIGAVIPAFTTQAQASSGELARLVDLIRREQVRAIFAESSVNAKVEDAIAQETGARVGRPLWADTLGPAGSDGATYAQAIRSNTVAIVEGLSGGTRSCTLPR